MSGGSGAVIITSGSDFDNFDRGVYLPNTWGSPSSRLDLNWIQYINEPDAAGGEFYTSNFMWTDADTGAHPGVGFRIANQLTAPWNNPTGWIATFVLSYWDGRARAVFGFVKTAGGASVYVVMDGLQNWVYGTDNMSIPFVLDPSGDTTYVLKWEVSPTVDRFRLWRSTDPEPLVWTHDSGAPTLVLTDAIDLNISLRNFSVDFSDIYIDNLSFGFDPIIISGR